MFFDFLDMILSFFSYLKHSLGFSFSLPGNGYFWEIEPLIQVHIFHFTVLFENQSYLLILNNFNLTYLWSSR